MHFRDTLRGGRLAALAFATLLSLVFAGCSGQSAKPAGQSVQPVVQGSDVQSMPALPQPSEVKLRDTSAVTMHNSVADFAEELPHNNVQRTEYGATFSPIGKTGISQTAYAIYPLVLESYNTKTTLNTGWLNGMPPQPYGESFWIALANWETDSWDWQPAHFLNRTVIDPINPYIRGSDSLMLIVIMCFGEYTATLNGISASYKAPAEVSKIWPIVGDTGSEIQISAEVSGTEPLNYTWEFGEATEPAVSYEQEPTIVLGRQGFYDCALTVRNSNGKYKREFQFRVNDSEHWQHSYEAVDMEGYSLFPLDCAIDSDDCLIVTGFSLDYLSSLRKIEKLFVMKIDQAGKLLWCKIYGSLDINARVRANGLAIDAENNIYAVGGYRYDAYSAGLPDFALILKLDPDGNLLWDRVWNTGIDPPEAWGVACAPDGTSVVAGFSGNYGTEEQRDLFILKLSVAGELVWQKLWEVSADGWWWSSARTGLEIDGNGVSHMVVPGVSSEFSEERSSAYLQISAEGDLQSGTLLPAYLAQDIAISADGSKYISGVDLLTGYSDRSTLSVRKLDSACNLVWAIEHEEQNADTIFSQISTGPSGQVGLACSAGEEYDFKITSQVAMEIDAAGSLSWAKRWFGSPYSYWTCFMGLVFDSAGGHRAVTSPIGGPYGYWEDWDLEFEPASEEIPPLECTLRDAGGCTFTGLGITNDLAIGADLGQLGDDVGITRF